MYRYSGSHSLSILQRLKLHRPILKTQRQQGIPISLQMGTLEYGSYPLDPFGSKDLFSDPLSLELDGELEGDGMFENSGSHHLT